MSTATASVAGGRPTRVRRPASRHNLTKGAGLGLGIMMLWFSLLVLIPLCAVVATAGENGWGTFLDALQNEQTANALKLTVVSSLVVTAVNIVMGTIIAWVLVRDRFWGKSVLNVIIDIPFALPTVVAGLVLLALYGPSSPIGVHWAFTPKAVTLALAFVTLPFVVRAVQPVLEEIERDVEEAGASLGASRATIFRRLILPNIAPAMAAGAALSFARGLGEYGSVVLISGSMPRRTEVASARMLGQIENDNLAGASAVAAVLLVVALVVIILLGVIQRRTARRG